MARVTTNAVHVESMPERGLYLTLRVSEEEREMLRELAERDGLSASDVVRQFIRRAHREAFPDRTATTKKRSK
jgi:uncharacterized protein (DUF1778 family)